MRLLDTNIILYAVGRPHPHKEPCMRLLQRVVSSRDDFNVDTELLQEVLYVYTSRGELHKALGVFDDLLNLFPNPIPIAKGEMTTARRFIASYLGIFPRDAIHASVVSTHHALRDLHYALNRSRAISARSTNAWKTRRNMLGASASRSGWHCTPMTQS